MFLTPTVGVGGYGPNNGSKYTHIKEITTNTISVTNKLGVLPLPKLQKFKGLIDLIQWEFVGDKLIQLQLFLHVVVY